MLSKQSRNNLFGDSNTKDMSGTDPLLPIPICSLVVGFTYWVFDLGNELGAAGPGLLLDDYWPILKPPKDDPPFTDG